jgi:hypothetical protein
MHLLCPHSLPALSPRHGTLRPFAFLAGKYWLILSQPSALEVNKAGSLCEAPVIGRANTAVLLSVAAALVVGKRQQTEPDRLLDAGHRH